MDVKPELQASFDKWVSFHRQVEYDRMVVDYAIAWAELMEKHLLKGSRLEDVVMKDSFTADHWGISGAQNGFAAGALSTYWVHGHKFRRVYNKSMGGTGREKGTINPAMYTVQN